MHKALLKLRPYEHVVEDPCENTAMQRGCEKKLCPLLMDGKEQGFWKSGNFNFKR